MPERKLCGKARRLQRLAWRGGEPARAACQAQHYHSIIIIVSPNGALKGARPRARRLLRATLSRPPEFPGKQGPGLPPRGRRSSHTSERQSGLSEDTQRVIKMSHHGRPLSRARSVPVPRAWHANPTTQPWEKWVQRTRESSVTTVVPTCR